MTILLDGMSGLVSLPIIMLLWAAMPLSGIVAFAFAYRGLRSALDWGWIGVAAFVLAAPYVAAVSLLGVGAFALLPLAFDIRNGIAFVALLNPFAGMLISAAVLRQLPDRQRPANGTGSRRVAAATRLTLDRGRARAAAAWFALAAGMLIALPAGRIDRRDLMLLLLFAALVAASRVVVRRRVDDTVPLRGDEIS